MFKWLPFGINSANEIFQRKMSELFENEAGIEIIIDDILVHGKTAEEHNRRLERTLRILQDVVVILNMSKCRFRVPRLIYFGHLVGTFGLGAVLLQQHDGDWKPVAFCSRTLTPTEVNRAQIEKECLAAVWACEKFSRYLVGLPCFCLETDHKWLVPLLTTKNLGDAPVRCQRLLMRMMRFNPDVHYVPGKYLAIADALLRKPLPDQNADITLDEAVEAHVEAVMSGWPASKTKLDEPNAIRGPEKLRRHLIFKSKISGNTLSNMENPETINHNVWICYLLWNMPENKDTSGLAVSHGPE